MRWARGTLLLILLGCYDGDTDYVGDPVVRFSSAVYSAAEKQGIATITVVRERSNEGELRVTILEDHLGSAEGGGVDFEYRTVTLTWRAGESGPRTFEVRLVDDGLEEGDETVSFRLGDITGGVAGDLSRAMLTIRDGDSGLGGALQFGAAEYAAGEGATATLDVTRTAGSFGATAVTVRVSGGTAEGSDYTYSSTTLRWADGDARTQSVTVPIVDDAAAEDVETVQFTLENVEGAAIVGTQSTTVLRISDNDATGGAIQFPSSSVSVNEGAGAVRLTVSRSGFARGPASVNWGTNDGTAGAGDYAQSSGSLFWGDGDTSSKSLDIPISEDAEREGNETFQVSLSSPDGATLGAPSTVTVTIIDNEGSAGTIQFAASRLTVDEGAGSLTITVRRTGSSGAASIGFETRDGSATTADYGPVYGTLAWADGEGGDKTFTVTVIEDGSAEPGETFEVFLHTPVGDALGSPSVATVTIQDNDGPPPSSGQFQFRLAEYRVSEGAGSASIAVQRVNGNAGSVSVTYVTNPGSASTGDYVPVTGTLFWGDGDAGDKSFDVTIQNDAEAEPDETLQLALQDPSGGATLGARMTATLVITNDDSAPAGQLQFRLAEYRVSEGAGVATISVQRVNGASGSVSVGYSANPGSASSSDFASTSGTLSWGDGDAGDKSFDVTIHNDGDAEPDETVQLALQDPSGGATLGARMTATLVIANDDSAPAGQLQFRLAEYRVSEGAGVATISVQRVNGSAGAVSVTFAADPGSASSADFNATSGTLSWGDGDAGDKTFDVTIHNDGEVEPDETVQLALRDPAGGATLGTRSSATLVLANDDTAPSGELQFELAEYRIDESAGFVTVTVTRTNGSGGAVSVTYETKNGSAKHPDDYTRTQGQLFWPDGDASPKTFSITIVNDGEEEGEEDIELRIKDVQGARLGAREQSRVVIVDDDGDDD